MASLRASPTLRFGVPFLAFMVLGTQALAYVTAGRQGLVDETEKQKLLLMSENRVSLPARAGLSAADAAATADGEYEIKRVPRPPGAGH